ncbi:MAG: di-trans,poly-cis-decaprenylcistransferase [Omnitrophica bacterium RIFCSPLOWO2_12_FULL_44_17]|uniref:Isoprenyl transferase n=1 Tax=Candidatus Danuiimicrobium aquiferis TaxID=1801832 RepID=A0A1G1KZK4_9BACT|nr:MAG: di-trans,poly-cis-decaprenylcistransferase [Omnitrophica bacterium RIFCSPHIGHO2_02_FULL_45_28]OGW88846.1 MAG: di-trans,poly-cis-decaprenylcistransferase [Omnitrophica bacterium RIFCSPHIGHO2_12_FULL_44_12]OGW98059.1 MAG: di-trans,poly-cis-decaprenylcistransferase [Omnitrophica bacterium RIFCSPLOWO2_12_FULL_44_17]OGX03499.1 MAG: di-trans,poly-cis-decaprenylcistransferase [Omnitrophica bacterium RIFCSPLOWO2_02_FULL_44_11]
MGNDREILNEIPKHVAIIMDGNGRWAKQRGMPRIMGHQKGVDTIREIVRTASDQGVRYLTLYAFSKENWNRPKDEVGFLMNLLSQYLDLEIKELRKNRVRFNVIGRIEDLPGQIQEKIRKTVEDTKNEPGLLLTLALSYSSRVEMIDAIKKLCEKVVRNELNYSEINEDCVSRALYTANLPDPDLLIRTSGEMRVSNFLLWQISYAEIYVSPKFWPDFTKEDFLEALKDYQRRERRFGRTERCKSV